MDRQITIQRATSVQDGFGEEVATWSDLMTIWAEVTPTRGAEPYIADRFEAGRVNTFRVRYNQDATAILETDRISYEGEVYDIHSIQELGRREGLVLTAEAKVL